MTNEEIDEYLAEHLFGCDKNLFIKNKPEGTYYALANGVVVDSKTKIIYTEHPDYISNYQPVLEKLIKLGWSVRRLSQVVNNGLLIEGKYVCEITHSYLTSYCYIGYGDTIGEAICRAAVAYDKAKRGGE